jgi:cadmium resistance protein CadD (predicted permease)
VIGLLGLVPILYGIRKLFPKKPDHKLDANLTIFMMTTLALGDGLDNISTYTTLFASETFVHVCILTGYFFFLLAIWYYIASTLAHFRMITLLTKKIDQSIPFIYLLLGAFIIYKNRTLTLLFEKVP